MLIKYLLFALFFAGTLTGAQNSQLSSCFLDHPLNLSEMVSIALDNNPQTRISWANAKKFAASVGIAQSALYPQLGIDAHAVHGRKFRFLNGPDVNFTNIGADLTLSMILYDFGRTQANIRDAKYALIAANWQTDWVLQKVMANVLENAYAAFHAIEVLKALEETHLDADHMLYTSQELNRSGLRSITDVYTTQASLALVRMEVAQQKAQVDIHLGKLAASMGLDIDTPLQLAPLAPIEFIKKEDVHTLIAFAKIQRADLLAQQARLAQSWEKVKKSRADYWPKLGLRGRGGMDHYVNDKANPAHYEISLNLEIPLFNGFETTFKNRYAYAEAEATEEELAQMELNIALEVLTHSRTLEAAEEMLGYAKFNMESSLKAYLGVIEKYKAGKEGIAELSNALRQLATSRIRYSDTKTKYLVSMANLAYATGTLAPQMEQSSCD